MYAGLLRPAPCGISGSAPTTINIPCLLRTTIILRGRCGAGWSDDGHCHGHMVAPFIGFPTYNSITFDCLQNIHPCPPPPLRGTYPKGTLSPISDNENTGHSCSLYVGYCPYGVLREGRTGGGKENSAPIVPPRSLVLKNKQPPFAGGCLYVCGAIKLTVKNVPDRVRGAPCLELLYFT